MEINGIGDELEDADMNDKEKEEETIRQHENDQEAIRATVHRSGICDQLPSTQEVADHMISDLPYRSW